MILKNYSPYIVILGSAIITYSLRLGGLLLSNKLPKTGRYKKFLEALPGTILLSLVLPEIVSLGIKGLIAAAISIIIIRKTNNLFLSMISALIFIAITRQF